MGKASLYSFLAAGELTRTDFDFLHDGLAFSGVSRVHFLLFDGVPGTPVKVVHCYNCHKLRMFRPHGLQTPMLTITNLASSKREWNNCFIKFSTLAYLEIIALDFNFTKRPEVDVAKNNDKWEIT